MCRLSYHNIRTILLLAFAITLPAGFNYALGNGVYTPTADFNVDGKVNGGDLAILAGQWLGEPNDPSADVMPDRGDGFVGMQDLTELAANWGYDSGAFITTWDTSLEDGTDITLALCGEVDATIEWGDGTIEDVNTPGPFVHDYGQDGIYTVYVTGTVTGYNSLCYGGQRLGRGKLIKVNSWGQVGFTSMEYAFANTTHLESVPATTEGLENVTDMYGMFFNAITFNGDISGWDTSNVTDMGYMLYGAYEFDRNIGKWDTSKVESMENMFYCAMRFDQDISNWDTSNVVDMYRMFFGALKFDQDISDWDTSNVVDMGSMFYFAASFDQDISDWDTSNVLDMSYMLRNACLFDQDLSGWCVTKIVSRPPGFDYHADSWRLSRPEWGTCP